jgi:hypothetical protein
LKATLIDPSILKVARRFFVDAVLARCADDGMSGIKRAALTHLNRPLAKRTTMQPMQTQGEVR